MCINLATIHHKRHLSFSLLVLLLFFFFFVLDFCLSRSDFYVIIFFADVNAINIGRRHINIIDKYNNTKEDGEIKTFFTKNQRTVH